MPNSDPRTPILLQTQSVEPLLEATGLRFLRPRQGLVPFADLVEALLPRGLREARVHLRVLVRFAFDGRLEVLLGIPDRHPGHRVADLLEKIEMAERVAGLGFGRVTEQAADVGIALDIRASRKIE